ncbi:MAG TPA: hypothetical protein HPP94_15250 [Desulfuromonadales bacterium]|nr:hypothetical protein [Desulfuromonadales bacterium]
MWGKRKLIIKAAAGIFKLAMVEAGSACISVYNSGLNLIRQSRGSEAQTKKAELERSMRASKGKILALTYEIGKEGVRLKWYSMLRSRQK